MRHHPSGHSNIYTWQCLDTLTLHRGGGFRLLHSLK